MKGERRSLSTREIFHHFWLTKPHVDGLTGNLDKDIKMAIDNAIFEVIIDLALSGNVNA